MTLPDNYPLEPRGVDDYPVKVGSMLLTLVDPHKGFESAYNRWYERDHYIAGCLIGPLQLRRLALGGDAGDEGPAVGDRRGRRSRSTPARTSPSTGSRRATTRTGTRGR